MNLGITTRSAEWQVMRMIKVNTNEWWEWDE